MSATNENDRVPCLGCGTLLSNESWGASGWRGRLGNVFRVTLCAGRDSGAPKKDCFNKAWWKARVCPGCGKPNRLSSMSPGTLCDKCCEHLAEGEKQNLAAKLLRVELKGWRLGWASRQQAEDIHGMMWALARAVSGRGAELPAEPEVWKTSTYVEATAEQQAALDELLVQFQAALKLAYKQGQKCGQDFVRALAQGAVSLNDLNKAVQESE